MTNPGWTPAKRVAFRFVFSYFTLYNFPFPLGAIPGTEKVAAGLASVFDVLSVWTAANILKLAEPVIIQQTGSGDTMAQYVRVLVFLVLAIAATGLWTALDRKRVEYARLFAWFHGYIRLALAVTMFGYGFAKIFPLQMGAPSLDRLVEPLGDFSPMGLLWTFIGFSSTYMAFTGFGEAFGGLLLCFRRTATLGALLLIAVLSNVVLLNFTFDVPVKLYSIHLLLMAFLIAAPDAARLLDVLVRNRATAARPMTPLFAEDRNRTSLYAMRTIFVGVVLATTIGMSVAAYRRTLVPKPSLYGIYDVTGFTKNGVRVPDAPHDGLRWKRVIFGRYGVSVYTPENARSYYAARVDSTSGQITFMSGTSVASAFAYSRPDSAKMVLRWQFGGDTVTMHLDRRDERDFLLTSRRFSWIQELPFNR